MVEIINYYIAGTSERARRTKTCSAESRKKIVMIIVLFCFSSGWLGQNGLILALFFSHFACLSLKVQNKNLADIQPSNTTLGQ